MLSKLLPLLAAGALIALFVSLGLWQLDRGLEKQALFDGFDRAAGEPAERLQRYEQRPRFSLVSLAGEFETPVVLLENQPLDGRQGAFVLSPLRTGDGEYVMVNRGWTPMPRDRRMLPPLPPVPDGVVTVNGHLSSWPRPGIQLGKIDYSQPLPWRVPYLEPAALAERLKMQLAPQILLAVDEVGPGLVQRWRPQVMAPERHRGYALQWFSLAAAVIVVTGIIQWRLFRNRKANRP